MTAATRLAIIALSVNAVLCVIYANSADTLLITTAIIAAALIMTVNGEHRR